MKKSFTLLLAGVLMTLSAGSSAQVYLPGHQQAKINSRWMDGYWEASWINCPNVNPRDVAVYRFRKDFTLNEVPSHFIVHVSADNRYKLFVNGTLVALGPCRGDELNWNYETVDLAPYLQKGRNILASVVWFLADEAPGAQMSFGHAAFLLQGNGDTEKVVNTNSSWRVMHDESYTPNHAWRVRGYYAAGATDYIDAKNYPQRWEQIDFDDSKWPMARVAQSAAAKGTSDYPGRLLVPRPIPQMELKLQRFQSVRNTTGISSAGEFARRPTALTIPANTQATILLDQGQETEGYPTLVLSDGRGADVQLCYAETLFEVDEKGHENPIGDRRKVEGRRFFGYKDRITVGGQKNFTFSPLWWRTWRYIQLEIKTADEPLVLNDIYSTFSAYPFQRAFSFIADEDPQLSQMLDIGWNTARLCANETYMDCPYYEQLQYFGDTRIQTMVTMFNTTDTCMVRMALEQGRHAMLPDGLLYSRYPTGIPQIISSYSLSWTGMVYDYWMYRGDETYVRTLLPAIRRVMSWFEQYLRPDGTLRFIPYWFFCDWPAGWPSGVIPREANGNSAYQDLVFLMALDEAAAMERSIGMPAIATHYTNLAKTIREDFRRKYWNAERQLFADTYNTAGTGKTFSQHTNIMAILTNIVEGRKAMTLCQRVMEDKQMTQATIYFRYYLNQAMKRAGLSNRYLDELGIWRSQLGDYMTTWAEMPEPTRSDCHAWGASPNIELFRTVLGIETDAPGFRKVRIAPALGNLHRAKGTMPHPSGQISVEYDLKERGPLHAVICLPEGITGTFVWNNKMRRLHSGENCLTIK